MGDLTMSDIEFSKRIRRDRSWVARLRSAGRLALDEQGRILVGASIERIKVTSGNRADVAERHALARDGKARGSAGADDPELTEALRQRRFAESRAALARATREEIELGRVKGQILDAGAVEKTVEDAGVMFRVNLEQLPARLAPELVGADLDEIRARLRAAVRGMLGDFHRELKRSLEELAQATTDGGTENQTT